MTVNLQDINFMSTLSGLPNPVTTTASFVIPSQGVATGNYVSYSTSTPLARSSNVGQIQINYGGLETVWRPICGSETTDFGNYELETLSYYSGGNMYVVTYAVNETGGAITLPTITVNIRIFLYKAPFIS